MRLFRNCDIGVPNCYRLQEGPGYLSVCLNKKNTLHQFLNVLVWTAQNFSRKFESLSGNVYTLYPIYQLLKTTVSVIQKLVASCFCCLISPPSFFDLRPCFTNSLRKCHRLSIKVGYWSQYMQFDSQYASFPIRSGRIYIPAGNFANHPFVRNRLSPDEFSVGKLS